MDLYDMGIAYNSKLKEVRENIEKLKALSFDLSKIESIVNQIESIISKDVDENYASFESPEKPQAFLHDSLINSYSSAIKKLDNINSKLKDEYEKYYKINAEVTELENIIGQIDETSIESFSKRCANLLKDIKATTTIDFNIEKPLVQRIYNLIYKAIKLELVLTTTPTLLENVKKDDVDIPYITELMNEEISRINDKKINDTVNKLRCKGIDNKHLLNSELILLLALYDNEYLQTKSKTEFLKNAEKYGEISEKYELIKKDNFSYSSDVEVLNNKKKKYFKRGIVKRILILLNTLLLIGEIGGSLYLGDKLAKGKDYKTTISTYDSSIGDVLTEEVYERGQDDSLSLTEYSPWDSPGYFRDNYTREIYTYNLSNLETDYQDIKSYLNPEIKDKITYTSAQETRKTKPDDYGYGENKYVIVEKKKDLNDYEISDRPFLNFILSAIFSIGTVSLTTLLFKKLSREKLKLIKRKSKDNKKELSEAKAKLLESSEQMKELSLTTEKARNDLIQSYDKLPIAVKSMPDVEEAKQKVLKTQR